MPSQDEVSRCLVMFYQSRNAHGWANYSLVDERVDEFCVIPKAKAELVSTLRSLADEIEKRYPTAGALRKRLDEANARANAWESACIDIAAQHARTLGNANREAWDAYRRHANKAKEESCQTNEP